MTSRELRDRIVRRAKRSGLDLTPDLAECLAQYYALLAKWNAAMNLTAFRLEPSGQDEAVDRLLIEPVLASRYLPDSAVSVLDIGSGGGSPAIPLALATPQLDVCMVESKTRKAVFLREAIRHLALGRATVESTRFEELLARPELHEHFDIVTIRAVRIQARILMSVQAFLRPGGHIFLFRGSSGATVAEGVAPPLSWTATHQLVESLRSILVILHKNN